MSQKDDGVGTCREWNLLRFEETEGRQTARSSYAKDLEAAGMAYLSELVI